MRTLLAGALVLAAAAGLRAEAPEAVIHVDAGKRAGPVSRYLTGACIEDVNHEIYGGLYSQMIFGESFQEPPSYRPLKGFRAFGGTWVLRGEELDAGGGEGPKLVSDHAPLGCGEAGVEVFFADRAAGNGGLIVKAGRVAVGADNFDGYEVSLNPQRNVLTLGRHRHNWEPIKDVPCPVPVGEWVRLTVRLTETTLEVLVNGRGVIQYEDRQRPLRSGAVGLRQWQRAARYRKLWVKADGHVEELPFRPNPDDLGPVSALWRGFRRGTAAGKAAVEAERPFVGTQAQRLTFVEGEGAVGVENRGLNRWGLGLKAGKVYEGHLWARADKPAELTVGLESRDGARSYARATLRVSGAGWQKLPFTLTPDAADPAGRFAVSLSAPGSVVLGYAFLQPGEWGRFKGLPVRRDVVEGLRDMGLTVLRYGGSMVNAPEYRWKKMIGPRDRRPPYRGFWYPQSSNGWGILDFLDLCEAAGFLAIPAFNLDETPQDMADFVAYVNGPADSAWGRKRAADGHPAPYRLRHLEVGNEERVDDKYFARFRAIAEAVWAVDPDIILVAGDFVYSQPITDPNAIKGAASGITSLAAHRQILDLARRHNREVWFDVHVDTDDPRRLGEVAVVPTYVEALAKLGGGARHRVAVFELNAGNHAQRRALANAVALGALQQLGDRLAVVCSANGLQPDGQNDNGWDQGLLFLNPTAVWLQPPGHVTRMIARHYQPLNVPAEVRGAAGPLRAAAARSENGRTLVLRVVHSGDQPLAARIQLDGLAPLRPTADVEELAGPADAVNTAAEPSRWAPRRFEWRQEMAGGPARYTFPPRSFTVLTFRRASPKKDAPAGSDDPAPQDTPVDVLRETHGRLPPAAPPAANTPVLDVAVDLAADEGPLELWRHGLGHGGINPLPLPERVVRGAARLKPRLVRVFIQEFFQVYPEHGHFDWSRLDPYMDALARTGAKVVAAITIKPKPLFPKVDAAVWRPNDVAEWQRVVAALVRRYSVDRPIVTHWEVGNETDIGEHGGCPYLIPKAADYHAYYKMTTAPILATFPGAKVGGPAAANGDGELLPQFIDLCAKDGTRLDFVSWHLYADDPRQHARLAEKYRTLLAAKFPTRQPETFVTEWNKGFERLSVEEQAFAPRRAAAAAAALLAMTDARVDASFYYHLWDQAASVEDFRPFFRDPGIMYRHWNEVPHRFGLFGVGQEVRPQYFVYELLGRLGGRRVRARCADQGLRVLAAKDGGRAAVLLVNYGLPASRDVVATVRFSGLSAGHKRLTVWRIDGARAWSARELRLLPTERREVDVRSDFSCQVASPADSVSLVVLEGPR